MPGLWLISRAPPGVDFSSLPSRVLDSIHDSNNLLYHYYIVLKDEEGRQLASNAEYWTLCWDMHDSDPRDCAECRHSLHDKLAYVRVDGVERPPPGAKRD